MPARHGSRQKNKKKYHVSMEARKNIRAIKEIQ